LKNGEDNEAAGSLRGGRRQGFALRAGQGAALDRARRYGSEGDYAVAGATAPLIYDRPANKACYPRAEN
jgi:hypothetical protein